MLHVETGDPSEGIAAAFGKLLRWLCWHLQYLWSQHRTSGATLLVIGPLNVFAVLLTELAVVRLLAATGLLMSVAQYAAMQHVRTEGMKLV